MSRHHIADEDEEFIMLVLSFQNGDCSIDDNVGERTGFFHLKTKRVEDYKM